MKSFSFPLPPPLSLLLLLLSSLSLLILQAAADPLQQPVCYWTYNNRLPEAARNDGPCGAVTGNNVVECCSDGDTCLGQNICHGPGGSHVGGSGYYLTGCTDSQNTNSVCTTHCLSNGYPDIVYNTTTGLWACCLVVNFAVNCQLPMAEVWSAPAPGALTGTIVAHAAASSTTSSTSSMTSTSTGSATPSIPASPTSSLVVIDLTDTGLPVGAKAGIAIGVATAFLALIGFTFAFIRSRRMNNYLSKEEGVAFQSASLGTDFGKIAFPSWGYANAYTQVPGEGSGLDFKLPNTQRPVELSATFRPIELGNWDNNAGGNFRIPKPAKKHDTYYHP